MFFKVFFISLTLIIPLTQAQEVSEVVSSLQSVVDEDLAFGAKVDCKTTPSVCECANGFKHTKMVCDSAKAKENIKCVEKPEGASKVVDSKSEAEEVIVKTKDAQGCIEGTISALKNECEKIARNCEDQCEQAIEETEKKIEEEETKLSLKQDEINKIPNPRENFTEVNILKNEERDIKKDIKKFKKEKENSENNYQACGDHYTTFFEDMNAVLGSVLSRLTPTLGDAIAIADLVGRFSQGGKGEKTPGPGGGDPHAECIKRGWTWNADSIIKCKKPTDPLDGGNGGKPTGGDPFGPLQPSGDPKGNPKGDPNGPNGPSPLNPILPPGGSGSTTSGGEGSGGSNNGSGGGGGIVAGGIASGGMGGGGFNHNEGEDSEDSTSAYKPHKQEYSGGGGGGRRGYASLNQGRRQMLAKLGIKVKPKKTKETSKRTSLIETSQHENIFARITSRFNELCKNKIDCY